MVFIGHLRFEIQSSEVHRDMYEYDDTNSETVGILMTALELL